MKHLVGPRRCPARSLSTSNIEKKENRKCVNNLTWTFQSLWSLTQWFRQIITLAEYWGAYKWLSHSFPENVSFCQTAELILRNNVHCSDAEMVLEPLLRERVRSVTVSIYSCCRCCTWIPLSKLPVLLCFSALASPKAVPKRTWRTWPMPLEWLVVITPLQEERLLTRWVIRRQWNFLTPGPEIYSCAMPPSSGRLGYWGLNTFIARRKCFLL